jgi:hypothetical protein
MDFDQTAWMRRLVGSMPVTNPFIDFVMAQIKCVLIIDQQKIFNDASILIFIDDCSNYKHCNS